MIIKTDEWADQNIMINVGKFLDCFITTVYLSESSGKFMNRANAVALLHKCSNSTALDRMKLILSLYKQIPSPLQLFRCQKGSSKQELHVFIQRAVQFPGLYVVIEVNRLTAEMQEVRVIS